MSRVQDTPVKISSQNSTLRNTLVVGGVTTSQTFYTQGLPRVFVSGQQTVGGVAATLHVDWAIRSSAAPATPEWLPLQDITLLAAPGLPVNTLLTVGAVWLRFRLTGVAGDTCELAVSSFV